MITFFKKVIDKLYEWSDIYNELPIYKKIIYFFLPILVPCFFYSTYVSYYLDACETALVEGRIIDWQPGGDGASSVTLLYEVNHQTYRIHGFEDGSKTRQDIGKKYWIIYCKEYPSWGFTGDNYFIQEYQQR